MKVISSKTERFYRVVVEACDPAGNRLEERRPVQDSFQKAYTDARYVAALERRYASEQDRYPYGVRVQLELVTTSVVEVDRIDPSDVLGRDPAGTQEKTPA